MDWAGWTYIFFLKEKEIMDLKENMGKYTEEFGVKKKERR